jgi:predicted nucleic acid-binding protein
MTLPQIANARRLCFDTNALIYLLEAIAPYHSWLFEVFSTVRSGERDAVFSVITETEAMVKPLRVRNRRVLSAIDATFAHPHSHVLDVTRDVARKAARLRAELGLTLGDAVIISTALLSGCDAVVGNDKECARRVTEIPYIYLGDVVR